MKSILYVIWQCTWGFLTYYSNKRKKEGLSYFSCYTESWANAWGEKVPGSFEQNVLDITSKLNLLSAGIFFTGFGAGIFTDRRRVWD